VGIDDRNEGDIERNRVRCMRAVGNSRRTVTFSTWTFPLEDQHVFKRDGGSVRAVLSRSRKSTVSRHLFQSPGRVSRCNQRRLAETAPCNRIELFLHEHDRAAV
jgi:hypothetical protein